VTSLTADSPIRATLRVSGPTDGIGTELADHAEATIREAISNAVRHSGATSLCITVTVSDQLVIDILDDGCGIPADNQRSSGLANLRRRAELAGGECQITTPAEGGTHIRWSAPYGVLEADPENIVAQSRDQVPD
jgi:signal transduction histidine kinase